ncbi:MAG: transporter [Chlamydiales bacterium]|nr:transporter [Chlamydiales bacterium]
MLLGLDRKLTHTEKLALEIRKIPCQDSEFVTLAQAISLAFKQNLEASVYEQQCAIQREASTGKRLAQLPFFALSNGDSSQPNLFNTQNTLERCSLYEIEEILDFSITYFQARQITDRTPAVIQQFLRAKQNLIFETFSKYSKAALYKQVLNKSKLLYDKAVDLQQQASADKTFDTEQPLLKERLHQINSLVQNYQAKYEKALNNLKGVLNWDAKANLDIDEQIISLKNPLLLNSDIEQLEELALLNQEEVYPDNSNSKTNLAEVKQLFSKILPQYDLFKDEQKENNQVNLYQNWVSAGAQIAANLLAFPDLSPIHTINRQDITQQRTRQKILSLGILTQIHLNHFEYLCKQAKFQHDYEILSIRQELADRLEQNNQIKKGAIAGKLDAAIAHLLTELKTLKQYIQLQLSLQKISNIVGLPIVAFTTAKPQPYQEVLSSIKVFPSLNEKYFIGTKNSNQKMLGQNFSDNFIALLSIEENLKGFP